MTDKITPDNCLEVMEKWFPRDPVRQAKAWCTVHDFCCQQGLNGYDPNLDWQRPGLVKVIEFIGKHVSENASLREEIELKDKRIAILAEEVNELDESETDLANRLRLSNEEIERLKKEREEVHNKIMTRFEEDFGSIHNSISMDAYTVSGFVRKALTP